MDIALIEAFPRDGSSSRWKLFCRRTVALTFVGLYFVEHGPIVVKITFKDPILVKILFFESSLSIQGLKLPFSERGLE